MAEIALIEITMRTRPLERELGGSGMLAVGNGLERFFFVPRTRRLHDHEGTVLGTTTEDPMTLAAALRDDVDAIAERIYAAGSPDEQIVDGIIHPTFAALCAYAQTEAVIATTAGIDGRPGAVPHARMLVRHLRNLAQREYGLERMVDPLTLRYDDTGGHRTVLPGTVGSIFAYSARQLTDRGLDGWAERFGVGGDGVGR